MRTAGNRSKSVLTRDLDDRSDNYGKLAKRVSYSCGRRVFYRFQGVSGHKLISGCIECR